MAITDAKYAEKIWYYFSVIIGNDYGVAGIMGNLYAESGLNPMNVQDSYNKSLGLTDKEYTTYVDNGVIKRSTFNHDGAGYGIAQWTYWSFKNELYTLAKERRTSIGDIDTQLKLLYRHLSRLKIIDYLKTVKSVREASDKVLMDFENPRNQSDSVKGMRESYGMNFYSKFHKSTNITPNINDIKVKNEKNKVVIKEKIDTAQYKDKSARKGVYLTVSAHSLNVRTGAGKKKQIIDTLDFGKRVLWYGYYNLEGKANTPWYYVTYDGKVGYVSSAYVR